MNKFVVVDLETTGNSPNKGDRIIQFAAVVIEQGEIVETYNTFINPNIDIPPFISELTNITNEMVASAPSFSEIAGKVSELLCNGCFVAHNVYFDLSFLQAELQNGGVQKFEGPVIDTVELTKILMPTLESFKLTDIATSIGFTHSRPHQADSDAFVTALLFLKLMDKMYQLPLETLNDLATLSKDLKSDISFLLHQMIQDVQKSHQMLDESLQVIRGLVIKKERLNPSYPINIDTVSYPISHEEKRTTLMKGFTNHEDRADQLEMMDAVYQTLTNKQIALIEAGAGLGKTAAYLLPAAYFSLKHKRKVVISVSTIQLQNQMMFEDIPRLSKMLPFPIQVAMIKGKQNYLSLWKFEKLLYEKNEHYDEVITKMQILVWLTETLTGDMDELNLSSGGRTFWRKVCSEIVLDEKQNPWKSLEFFERAKLKASEAQLIITNHYYLLADLVYKENLLPEYEHMIIDEAHHFENATTTFFGHRLEYNHLRFLISRLGTFENDYLLSKIFKILLKYHGPLKEKAITDEMVVTFAQETDDLFRISSQMVKHSNYSETSAGKVSIYIKSYDRKTSPILYSCERLYGSWKALTETFDYWNEVLEEHYREFKEYEKILVDEWYLFVHDFISIGDALKDFIFLDTSKKLNFIETDARETLNQTSLYCKLIFPGEALTEHLYSNKQSIVFTSATMTVNNSFRYFKDQLGLKKLKTIEHQYPSPFNYEKQSKVFILNDLPDVSEVDTEEYAAAISSHITSIAESTKGRLLVLFTSYDMMKKTYFLVKDSGILDEYVLLAQGISGGSQNRLTKHFQQFDKAVLFGTNSLWEGVDIPGEALTALIIVRLPFSSPQDPITEARSKVMKNNGKSSFYEYALPEAILRFKQGFGRLIRTKEDKGCFIVFDKRILTSKYGSLFLQSLPTQRHTFSGIDEVCSKIELWLDSK